MNTLHPVAAPATARSHGGASAEEIEALYRDRRQAFLRVAERLTGDVHEAHDAVQDAFARALRKRGSFRREGSLEAWLWRVVVNSARNQRRKRVDTPTDSVGEGPAADGQDCDRADLVRTVIAELPERQRLVLFLRYYADLDYPAIASALRIRVGTVGSTLNHAHTAVRSKLERTVQ